MDKEKRVLIFYASIGSGHEVAAKALHHSLRQHRPDIAVLTVDALFPVKKRALGEGEWISSLASFLASVIFPGLYDQVWNSGEFQELYQRVCRMDLFQSHIQEAVHSWKPDLVVCTHSLPASVLVHWQKYHADPIPIIAVATDYEVHPYWPKNDVTQFIVPSHPSKEKLAATGVDERVIFPFGIPLRPDFHPKEHADPMEREKFALVLAGGSRSAAYASLRPKILAMWEHLNQMPSVAHRWDFVVGKNSRLESYLRQTNQHPDQLRVYGYVRDLPRLMRRADLVIAKPGGLTTAEALALGKPLVCLVSGIGQERANLNFLLATGAGMASDDPQEAVSLINSLLDDDPWRQSLHQRAAQWGRPDASRQIAHHLINLLNGRASHLYQPFFNTSATAVQK